MIPLRSHSASIALVSLLSISVFTMVLVLAMTQQNFSSIRQRIDAEAQDAGYYLAEACFEEAAHRLEGDPTFTTGAIQLDADLDCSISVTGTTPRIISVDVNFTEYTQSFQGTALLEESDEGNNLTLTQWHEIP